MKKDVIYIDTEDDITSIIDKVKASKEKIIALVPPKRVGVLQSAVNLKLLQKSATTADKRIVLITHSKPLAALAAGVAIPSAKNLQSKPELVAAEELPEDDESEDIINGEDMPVGELEKTAPAAASTDPEDEIELPENIAEPKKGPKKGKGKKSGPNVPNFDMFRKKLFLLIAGGILLVLFLIWSIWFAPHATVNIKAKTTKEGIEVPISLDVNGTTDIDAKVIKPTLQQIKKTSTTDFTATGKKDVGEKASGRVTISNCATASSISVPAGTAVSSDGLNFMTATSVSVPGGSASTPFGPCTIPGRASVSVQAQEVGEEYNLSSGSSFTVAGQSSAVSASNNNDFSGGSKRTVTVVSSSDIQTARSKIVKENKDSGRKELEDKFDEKDYVIIDKSYKANATTVTSAPAQDAEASSAKLTVEITYSLLALDKDDVNSILNNALKEKIDERENQKVYDNGIKQLEFNDYSGSSVTLNTSGYVGPRIDIKDIKPKLVGKNYEDIRQMIKAIDGVDDVNTVFFPFWISTAPSADKIDIKFVVQKNE